ncbi:nicotinamide riboside transporter PnuC [Calycomorphotria hydatis]|uniref:Nicotinamide riboside transporter PnuC n=1 Tax=Calycomorphotria hydatis TaxID=2528027 RepID=A0A517T927_9PLAN|nr:nicotinamide riboside transporter PnuC [Calycomorphotria hydatis]QDT64885.1 Nicotinamide riboside transporter PnuC [Calycomorphotria hydatis]
MTWIELTAVAFGIACVVLTIRQNIWCWPTGLVQVLLFIVIFYQVKLYSDLALHVIYVFLQLYGWYHWAYGGKSTASLKVTLLRLELRLLWLVFAVFGTFGLGFLMSTYTDASLPYGDAFTTVVSLIAQWFMTRKKLESWICWVAVDVVAIGIYLQKELYLTTGLYAIFLVLAISGYVAWLRSWHTSSKLSV